MLDEAQPVLKLISATRLSPEKGLTRMIHLAEKLRERNVSFIWHVFTNNIKESPVPEFVYMQPKLDILGYIKDADFLVQLSDTEGFAYSIIESLCVGTPLLVTNFPVIEEMGIVDEENAYVFKMDMSNTDEIITKMTTKKLKGFKYVAKQSNIEWNKIFGPPEKVKYKYNQEALTVPGEKDKFVTIEQLKLVRGRGFSSLDEAKFYSETEKFTKLSGLEQEEFLTWLKNI
jgi:hypothetical protein